VAGEGVDKTSDESSTGFIEQRGASSVTDLRGGQRRAGALKRAVHRRDGDAKEVGDFSRSPTEHLA
jgi:hypothetical protein